MIRYATNMHERRGGHRTFLRSQAQIRGAATHPYQSAQTLDVSMTGARLEFDHPLPPGTEVSVNLKPEPGQHIRLSGRVVWQSYAWNGGYEAGVRFYPMQRPDRAQLDRWLNELRRSEARSA